MIDHQYRWYPVYTKSRAEKKAYEELQRKQIKSYLPLKKTLKQWSDRKKWVEEPLLKSYLFVYISNKEYAEVLMTLGISRFLYFSGQIASIPNQQIEGLQLLLATATDLKLIEYAIQPGEKVRITAGPFQGMLAELVSLNHQKSIILRLDHLGYSMEIKTSMAFVEPL